MGQIYIPPGYVWIIDAVLLIVQYRYPSRWTPEKMLPGEGEVWDKIATNQLSPEFIEDHILYYVDEKARASDPSTRVRLNDYGEAILLFRGLIAEGAMKAHFINERGQIEHINGEGLRAPGGEIILSQGYVFLEDSPKTRRYLFVEEAAIIALFNSDHSSVVEHQTVPSNPKAKRKRGAVSLGSDDQPLVAEMHRLIETGAARSISAAAGMVVSNAPGLGSEESKLTRLRKRYADTYTKLD
ncbi:hypothetical protein [Microvirga aerophila]|nr:hypothetical protein [Microvirga aerophila]